MNEKMSEIKHTWGTAVIVTAKDGAPREWAAVRFENGKSGYTAEGDIYENVPPCRTLNAAVVRAVARAALLGDKVTDKARERYPHALKVEREDVAEKAAKAAERAAAALDAAKNALAKAAVDAATMLATIPA